MFFLIRVAFWLSVVVVLLPTGKTEKADAPSLSATEAISAATVAVSDMRQFCARQPEACAVGSQAAQAFGQKAQASAKMLYEFLTEKNGEAGADASGKPAAAEASAKPAQNASQNTLTQTDRAPAWRGPAPAKAEVVARRPT